MINDRREYYKYYAVKGRIDATYGKSKRHAAAAKSLITILCRLCSVCTYGSIDKYFLFTVFHFFPLRLFRPKLTRKI